MLRVQNLTKTYATGSYELTVLKDVSFCVGQGETCSLVGPSGSGKTTLLGLCAGLDRPSTGSVALLDIELGTLSEDGLSELRGRSVGFVFQSFQLIPTLTAIENVMVPLELRGERQVEPQAKDLLDRVGLGDRVDHYPTQLSGGEQQRVAIARAFINRPRILFADEPTGNLDADTSHTITDLLFDLNKEAGTTLLMATHDLELAGQTDRVIRLHGGELVSNDTVDPESEPPRLEDTKRDPA
jgi:putative ABC transport system ATP-binding protein